MESKPRECILAVPVSGDFVETLAQRAAAIVEERRGEEDAGFLDVRGAARLLSLSPKSIYSRVERGELPVHRLGHRKEPVWLIAPKSQSDEGQAS